MALLDQCPHCKTKFVQAEEYTQRTLGPTPNDGVWQLVRCQNPECRRLSLMMTSLAGEITIYPAASYDLDPKTVSDKNIREDYKEAGLCLSVGALKASATMSRRVLQRCLKAQGCNQRQLTKQLEHAIESGILRKPLQSLAKEIKEYGDLGAHPDDNQLSDMTPEQAKHVFKFGGLIIEEFYNLPAAAEQLRKERMPDSPAS